MSLEPINNAYRFQLDEDDVFIGDPALSKFQPSLRLTRWNNECDIKIVFDDSAITGSKKTVLEDNKVKWETKALDLHFYPLSPTEQFEHGGAELEFIFKEKTRTNTIRLPIETQELRIMYQLPLNQMLNPQDYDILTESEAWRDGEIVEYRPPNIVGSLAIYHISKKHNKYKTGKICHIPRPDVHDAEGKTEWCSLNIENGFLIITIPQQFLDEAVYPVTVGEVTIGKTDVGQSTHSSFINNVKGVCRFQAGTSGTITAMHAYVNPQSDRNMRAISYDDSSGDPYNLLEYSSQESCASGAGWKDVTGLSWDITNGTYYHLGFHFYYVTGANKIYWYYDSGVTDQASIDFDSSNPSSDPYDTTPTHYDYELSVYGDVSGGGATYTKGYAADTLIMQPDISKNYAADILVVQPDITKGYAADVLLKGITSKGYPADVLLKGTATKGYPADTLLVQPDITKPYVADTILVAVVSKEYPADVLLKGTTAKPYQADILVKGSTTKEYAGDVLLKGITTKPYPADVLLKAIISKNYLADAIIIDRFTKEYATDVLLMATDTKGYPADVLLVDRFTKEYAADVLLLETLTKNYLADVIVGIFDTYTRPYLADTLLKGVATKPYQADVLLLESLSKPYLADTLLVERISKQYLADTLLIQKDISKPYPVDVLLKGITLKEYLADIIVVDRFTKPYLADVLLMVTEAKPYPADVILKAVEVKPYPADVLIQQLDIPKDYLADVVLKGISSKPYFADVLVKGEGSKSYQADVIIGPVVPPPHVAVNLYASIGTVDLRASSGKVNLYARKKEELELV